MGWKPSSEKDVWPGQDWRFPDGEVVHVGAIMSDAYERTALCACADGGVLHLPASTLIVQAEYLRGHDASPQ